MAFDKTMNQFQNERLQYQPLLPSILKDVSSLQIASTSAPAYPEELQQEFPHLAQQEILRFNPGNKKKGRPLKVGIVFSGGQASGGHNVVAGLFDALSAIDPNSCLLGFLGGPGGLLKGEKRAITAELLTQYRNTGGFDLLGSDRTKLDKAAQDSVINLVQDLDLDGLVIVGGDDSNTNAAFLAEAFFEKKLKTCVIGVPKTIDGDLKSEHIEISFGFDTAAKTYSHLIGNLARDALSAKKHYFFVKLMGRTASHLTLECALQTHPNYTLIGEEILDKKKTLQEIVKELTDLICARSKEGKDYGIILIPEGILDFIVDCKRLMKELSTLDIKNEDAIAEKLSAESKACFFLFPKEIRAQLLLDRDPHGNLQVSKIETEKLFIGMVAEELKRRKKAGEYQGSFNSQSIFYGYEGRSCFPSNFDANYCYSLGYVAASLLDHQKSGYMAALQGLVGPVENWHPLGIPLLSLMNFEERQGVRKAVIEKALVNLQGQAFVTFQKQLKDWSVRDHYRYPEPIQYFGPSNLTNQITFTLLLEYSSLGPAK